MTLYQQLQKVTSEEDVKDAYIKALGLKEYQKNLIDIQTKEIWFEAKHHAKLSSYAMFTQLMHYVQEALNKGGPVRDALKLNRADVGWYQVRKALQARNASGDLPPVSFLPLEVAYKALTEKLQPMVYELGFLRT